jgi:hypothetical protein
VLGTQIKTDLSNGVSLRSFGMLRLKLDGARLDKLMCLGQAALGDGNIYMLVASILSPSVMARSIFSCSSAVGLVSLSSRTKPILKVQLEAF